MHYSIEVMQETGFIKVTTTGEWIKERDDNLGREIMKTIASTGIRKVLIDMRELQFDLPLFTIFQRAQELRDQRLEYDTLSGKVALVYAAKDKKTNDDFSFFETTAQNRGLPYRTFQQMEPALEWLTT